MIKKENNNANWPFLLMRDIIRDKSLLTFQGFFILQLTRINLCPVTPTEGNLSGIAFFRLSVR